MPIPRRLAELNPDYSIGKWPEAVFSEVDPKGRGFMQVRGPRKHRFGSGWSRFVAPKQTAEIEQAIVDNMTALRRERVLAALGKGPAVRFENGRPAAQAAVRKMISDYKTKVRNRTVGGFAAAAGLIAAAAVVDRHQKRKVRDGLAQVDEPPMGMEEKLGPTAADYHPAVDGLKHAASGRARAQGALEHTMAMGRVAEHLRGQGRTVEVNPASVDYDKGVVSGYLRGRRGGANLGAVVGGAAGLGVGGLIGRAFKAKNPWLHAGVGGLVGTAGGVLLGRHIGGNVGASRADPERRYEGREPAQKTAADLVTAHVMGRVSKSSKAHGRTLTIEKIRTALRLARATQPRTVTRHGNRFAKNETVMKHVGGASGTAGTGGPWASLIKKVQMRLPPGLEIK